MAKIHLSNPAVHDLFDIWDYTETNYGAKRAKQYFELIQQAFRDIEEKPGVLGSRARHDLGDYFRSYHLSFSKNRSKTVVKKPRHFVIYFTVSNDTIVVSRILHDAMDIERHIPDEHKRIQPTDD